MGWMLRSCSPPVLGLEEGVWGGQGPVSISSARYINLARGTQQWGAQGRSRFRVQVAETVPPLAVQRSWMRSWQPPRSLR